jgi:rhodanese-related sulfurtransferase
MEGAPFHADVAADHVMPGDMDDMMAVDITVGELARRRFASAPDGGALAVLDVREPWEVEICRLPDSIDIPLALLPDRLAALPRDGLLVVLCHHGMRSRQAVRWLRANGIANAINLTGGIDAWARQIDPAMRTY